MRESVNHKPRGWGYNFMNKVKSAVSAPKQEAVPLPVSAKSTDYWHPAMVPNSTTEQGTLPRFALPTTASVAKITPSVKGKARGALRADDVRRY